MSRGKYILHGHEPVEVSDVLQWAQWFENSIAERIVAKTTLQDGSEVSTVFLGLDHNFSKFGPPLLFETMIFGGPRDGEQWRSWEEAEVGHAQAVTGTPKRRIIIEN